MKTVIRKTRRLGAVALTLAVLLGLFPAWTIAADSDTAPTPSVTFTFSDSGITVDKDTASGYTVEETTLTITSSGTYGVTGSCSEGSIVVKGSVTGVKLVMTDLTLSCSTSAPLLCKKASGVTLWLSGTSVLTDKENPDDEDSTDETVADAFEGAAVKVNKDGASLLIRGSGSLTADGSSCKNGIKAGAESTVTVSGGTLNIKAANNGLAADGAVIIKGGTLNITAGNDGIKSYPEDEDTASAGTITIYDGDITIHAESDGINASGDIAIYGGTFTVNAQSDGIQTDSNLTISDGTFHITTLDGYNSSSFYSSTMSCKGLKASSSDDETSDTSTASNTISISGGTFVLNTADDAVHSDAYVEITGGTFTIQTGDDGMHADTSLILGTSGGTVARDPDVTVKNSYEGLEAGTVYIYSGRYHVTTSDDGINAAGGSSSGSDPQGGGGNTFNPGGGGPGGRSMRLMGADGAELMATGDYSLNIAGGHVYVNAGGDGLDSNGSMNLTGGEIEVWAQYNSDNEPLDYDGTLTVRGATVFAAGSAGMGVASPASGSQSYVNVGGSSGGFGGGPGGGSGTTSGSISISTGNLVTVKDADSSTVYQASAPKNANYVFFSSPDSTSWSVAGGSGSVDCQYGNDWTHSWNSGTVTTAATSSASGVRTYTCSACEATETETIPMLVSIPEDADDSGDDTGDDTDDTGFTVTFTADEHAAINVYYTQDYTTADETNVTSTVSRDSDTGKPDSTGSGQVNFTVVLSDGYAVDSVSVTEGTYKNLRTPDETGAENTWRVTKISGDTTITVTTKVSSDSGDDSGDDTGGDTDITAVGIAVKTSPAKTTYSVGDSFDPSGLVLTVTYSDGSTTDVTYSASAGMAFTGFDSSTAGTMTITVTCADMSATFPVTVEASSSTGGNTGDSSGSQNQRQACYVATSVYGSYDCPEVWTLRRFRDDVLGETWYGRLFIRCYYAVSPTVVRLFGDCDWFRNFWRGRLDSMVSHLQERGFASTPYEDPSWP